MTKLGRVTTFDSPAPPFPAPSGMQWVSEGCRRVDDERGYLHWFHRLKELPPSPLFNLARMGFIPSDTLI